MSTHAPIVVTAAPAGRFLEGTIVGTAKPGQVMEPVPGSVMDARGRHSWRVYQPGTDGEKALVAVLREAQLLGKTKNDAYADGDAIWLYCPIPGDDVQILMKNEAGTSTVDTARVGGYITLDSGTGKGVPAAGTEAMIPFQAQEDLSGIAADTHVLCWYTGQ